MDCIRCGTKIQDGMMTCPHCGERVVECCPDCGNQLRENDENCPICGHKTKVRKQEEIKAQISTVKNQEKIKMQVPKAKKPKENKVQIQQTNSRRLKTHYHTMGKKRGFLKKLVIIIVGFYLIAGMFSCMGSVVSEWAEEEVQSPDSSIELIEQITQNDSSDELVEPETQNDKSQESSVETSDVAENESTEAETGNAPKDFILPFSSSRYYSESDLVELTKEELRFARNEIYAIHGRKFESEDLNNYFSSKSWYHGYLSQEEFDDNVLNAYEKANLDLIKSVESGQSDSGSGSFKGYLEAYTKIVNQAHGSYGNNLYLVYDIDQDGIPELIVQEGTCEADYIYAVYTYNGVAQKVGSILGGHTVLYGDFDQSALISVMGHMGYQIVTQITMKNGVLNENIIAEGEIAQGQDYYSTPYEVPYAYTNDLGLLKQ